MKITDWSITPDKNTSVDGLSIAPGAAARNVGGALRAIMAGVKAAADESGEVEQFFADHTAYQVNGAGAYLSAIAPSDGAWGTYLSALAADYASADRGALRIPYSSGRLCHVLAFTAGTEVTVYIPSQRLIRTYSSGQWADLWLDGLAPLASPALSGTPTAPTAAAGTDTAQIATTAFVQTAVAAEASERQSADSTLTTAISGEQSAREAADAAINSTLTSIQADIDAAYDALEKEYKANGGTL